MGRKSTQDLIRKIITSLTENSKSISEIVERTKLDRAAVSRYLDLLEESGLLVGEQRGNSKIFTLVPKFREDTFFGLPLEQEAEKNANTLFYLIRENWKKNTNKSLLKTQGLKNRVCKRVLCTKKARQQWST